MKQAIQNSVKEGTTFYRRDVSHDAGSLMSVRFLILLAEHKGYNYLRSVDENMFLVQHVKNGSVALFFLAPPSLAINPQRAGAIINRIGIQVSKLRERPRKIVVVARRFDYSALIMLKKKKWSVYSAQDLRVVSKRLLIGGASDDDAYQSIRYGLSPPMFTTLRILAGLVLLASAMVPAMMLGAWRNSLFLTIYPLVLTLVVGGAIAYYKWYSDMEVGKAILWLIIYSAIMNFITYFVVPTYIL